jgi:coenzyme F420-reducing hydrogenase delta subunit
VLVSGCHPGDCHYASGNYHARRKLLAFRELMTFFGIDPRRFKFSWVSAAEGAKWSSLVKEITAEVQALGPFENYSKLRAGGTGE